MDRKLSDNSAGEAGDWEGLDADVMDGVLPTLDKDPWGLRGHTGCVGATSEPDMFGETSPEEASGGERYVLSIGYELKRTGRLWACSELRSSMTKVSWTTEDEVDELVLSVSDEDASALSSATMMLGVTVSVLVEGVISAISKNCPYTSQSIPHADDYAGEWDWQETPMPVSLP